MIASETPYKHAEIIRDTWPGIYRKPQKKSNLSLDESPPVTYNKNTYLT